ncbi:MAG: ABC transporter substrate-binding protein [Enterobacterales bacterium]|nr:ABC transporter substrate-binding protein [Enterobacterales bacterium]
MVRDHVLVYCSEASPQSFNPQLVTSGPTFDASSRQLYNRLIEFKQGTSLLTPSLATRWEISDDGLEYTFYLRQGVKFHHTNYFKPSRDFNADDVIFSFQRQWKTSHPYHHVSQLSFRYFDTMGMKKLIKRIVKINDYQVKFLLTRPDAPFVATLAMDFASILSKEYADYLSILGTPQNIDTQPVGTGPFQFIRYQADAFIRYKSHPGYWKGKEPLDGLVFAITQNPSLRFARLIAGECDLMASPLPIHIQVAKNYPQLQVLSEPGSNVAYLALNTNKKPFDNPLVRKALNYAINKKALIKIVYNNAAVAAKNPIPPNMWSYNKAIEPIPFSLEKAKQLLTEAGFENGFSMELWAMPVQRSYNPNAIKMAELIQQDLAKIGISAKIISYEFGTYLHKIKQGEHQAALLGWIGDNGDPDNFFTSLLSCAATRSGNNSAFWCDDEFDQLVRQAGIESNIKVRSKLYKKAQVIFNQANPWVPIAHSRQFVLTNQRVKNFHLTPTDGMYFSGVSLASEKTIPSNNQIDKEQ